MTTTVPTSPYKKRRHQILHMLGVKGSAVGDYAPVIQQTRSAQSSPTHTSSLQIAGNLTSSISANDITSLDYSDNQKVNMKRSVSSTPDNSRRRRMSMPEDFRVGGASGRIVRVALENDNNCVYKSLLVSLCVLVCACFICVTLTSISGRLDQGTKVIMS